MHREAAFLAKIAIFSLRIERYFMAWLFLVGVRIGLLSPQTSNLPTDATVKPRPNKPAQTNRQS